MLKSKSKLESMTFASTLSLLKFTIIHIPQANGPDWKVPLGRRDSLTANQTLANQNLPAPFFNLTQLKDAFAAQGLNTTDLVALSGTNKNILALKKFHFHN